MTPEEVILGQALQDNTIAIAAALTVDHFENTDCRRGWQAIMAKIKEGGKADLLTLMDAGLKATWISGLTNYPTSENWRYFATKVHKAYARRELRKLGLMLSDTSDSRDPQDAVNDVLDRLQKIAHIQEEDRPYTLNELGPEYISLLEKRYNTRGELPGIPTGLLGLDSKLLGFEQGKYYVIGARPSQGKSALLVTMFGSMIKKGVRVGFLSLESSRNEILDRLIAQEARVDSRAIKTGNIKHSTFPDITHAIDRMMKESAVIYDEPNVNIGVLQMQAKYMQQRHGVEIILIDYIQIAKAGDRTKPQHEQVAEISMALKQLARELKIPVVAAAQLRRDAHGKRPAMDDLAQSGQIERDADGIGLIWHNTEKDPVESWLIVEKNRDGQTGDVPVFFRKEYAQFMDRKVFDD